ncbi:MAG: glycosyltransferase family 2 protein [Solirubrobacteraceae bacterium]
MDDVDSAQAPPVRLSVCIPTYNFGAFIGDTLASIVPQLVPGVEVVILDGGSTDDTGQVVESFTRSYPAVRYHRQNERGGIDRDMARTVELARGEYCWIFCADDIMKPGAINQVLGLLHSGCELYLCGFTLCSFDMESLKDHKVARLTTDREFDLSVEQDRRAYFERAQTTVAFFSFAGSLIVRRDSWEQAGPDEQFIGSLWAHVAQILRMIPHGLRLHYIASSLLYKRTENDSFMDRGIVHRYAKAIDGYHRLAEAYFPEDGPEARGIRRVVTNEFPPWVLLAAKLESRRNGRGDEATVDRLAAKTYRDASPRNRLDRLLYRSTPLVAFAIAQAFNRRVVLRLRRSS